MIARMKLYSGRCALVASSNCSDSGGSAAVLSPFQSVLRQLTDDLATARSVSFRSTSVACPSIREHNLLCPDHHDLGYIAAEYKANVVETMQNRGVY